MKFNYLNMSIELSPGQEKKLHSILDKGIDAFHESFEVSKNSSSSIGKVFTNSESSFESSSRNRKNPKKSSYINSEIKELQQRLAGLESKLTKKSDYPYSAKRKQKSPLITEKQKSPFCDKNQSQASLRVTPTRIKSLQRTKEKTVENSEKMIKKFERSITPSPATKKFKTEPKKLEKMRVLVEKERKIGEKLRIENENLKKEVNKRDDLKNMISKLQEEYNELAFSFEKSESVRKKQKELINQLKNEINSLTKENFPGKQKKK